MHQQVGSDAVCVLADYRAWGYDRHPAAVRPRGPWWGAPRWSLRTLWRGKRLALAQRPDGHPARAGTRGTWAAQDAWLHRLDALPAAAVPVQPLPAAPAHPLPPRKEPKSRGVEPKALALGSTD